MLITKKYHFYAAHRNASAGLKCSRLHGHQYNLKVTWDVGQPHRIFGVTTLFSDLDKAMGWLLEKHFDHKTLAYDNDDLLGGLPPDWLCVLPFPTSAEFVAFVLFHMVTHFTCCKVFAVQLQETNSAIVTVNIDDYEELRCQHLNELNSLSWWYENSSFEKEPKNDADGKQCSPEQRV